MKKIVFFMPESKYGVLQHFTKEMAKSFKKMGIETAIFNFEEEGIGQTIEHVNNFNPNLTFTFNPIKPLRDGTQLCDQLKIPHFTFLVGASIGNLFLLNSPYSLLSCVDKFFVEYIKASDFNNILFLPHGVPADFEEEQEKEYDITMLATCVDFEMKKKSWKEKFDAKVVGCMERAVEQTLSNSQTPYFQTLFQELGANGISPRDIPISKLFREVQQCVKGAECFRMVQSIKDAEIHVFGGSSGEWSWKDLFGSQKNVIVHDEIPYRDGIEVLRKSKITLCAFSTFKCGSHERIFYALAGGTAVLASETLYTTALFKEKEGVLFYRPWDDRETNKSVNQLLSDETLRKECVAKGRKKVLSQHTWNHRAEFLIQKLPKMITAVEPSC